MARLRQNFRTIARTVATSIEWRSNANSHNKYVYGVQHADKISTTAQRSTMIRNMVDEHIKQVLFTIASFCSAAIMQRSFYFTPSSIYLCYEISVCAECIAEHTKFMCFVSPGSFVAYTIKLPHDFFFNIYYSSIVRMTHFSTHRDEMRWYMVCLMQKARLN